MWDELRVPEAVRAETFRAEGKCLKAAKNLLLSEASVFDEEHALVCTATSQLLADSLEQAMETFDPKQGSRGNPVRCALVDTAQLDRDERQKRGQIYAFHLPVCPCVYGKSALE